MTSAAVKAEVIKKYQRAEGDTGSPEVQIALLTTRIRGLQSHFTENKGDKHSRVGLMRMVTKRSKLMRHLKQKDLETYRTLIKDLEIRG